ncbi:AMP-dependent synthetase/ligase [Egicoccus halophilus]|uniref:Acyl-CoA synthetase n=1 Tax=Egicoccus halophilus TaxID=1670830 RepID=A0A8J3AC02_9ACTN|nr:AMP-dependent synthetase/ligase [Egicoccus halophilus]GGI04625.1 long-chain acyl-CoA synthetase [Egicoccus halophilus]
MQEYTSPGEVAVADDVNLTGPLFDAARTAPDRIAVAHRVGDRFVEWTLGQFVGEIQAVAKGLIGLGIEPGQRVCLMSATRLEWTILDYAIWAAGGVSVPIYETSSPEQVEWIVSDSGAVAIVVETPELRAIYDQVADRLPDCAHAFVIEQGGMDAIKAAGTQVTDEQVEERAATVRADDLATLVYTSGTTGRPKGCELTHRNFVWNSEQSRSAISNVLRAGESTLLFLPLAHIFARYIQVAVISAGAKLGFSTGIPNLLEELGMFRPTFLLAVPRVFEKVYNGAQQKAHGDGKGKIFDRAAAVAEQYSREQAAGDIGFATKLQHALFDKLVYGKLRAAMGGEIRYAVSGGAALGERLGHFFNGIGVLILEGYGLTETTAPTNVNRPDAFKIGTVGKPLPGVSVRIGDDGEIAIKGGCIFRGYYNNAEATREVLEDGWFRTGDLGQLDGEGYLKITGRKKEILVTAGGKNVAPAILEDRMRAHALVSQSMVVGDGRPFIAALVTIDPEAFATWAEANGKSGKSVADLVDDADLRAEVQKAIDEANQAVSKAESIRTFRILPEDFEVGVELSQKMSVKRHVVTEKYGHVVEDIYTSGSR